SGNTPGQELSFAVPPGAFTCGFSDGWFLKGRRYVYVNESGIIPPTCGGNSANGLRSVKFTNDRAKNGTVKFTLQTKNSVILEGPQGAPPVLIVGLSANLGDAITSRACAQATLTCKSNASAVSCR